jgi:1-acyl-sn-glycerol-3-phosphate acyltransferase
MLLRSTLFNVISWASVAVFAPFALLTVVVPFAWRYAFIIRWAWFQLWLADRLLGITYEVEGRENIPSGSAVVLSKHQSAWETLAFQEIFPPSVWILKRELLWVPLFGWALALLRPIAINRSAGQRALDQIVTQGRERLDKGIWVVVFPEGTRVAPRQRVRYKIGGAALAAATGYPVVPVAHNAGSFWPRRGFVKRPGVVRIVIGPAIPTRGRTALEVIADVERWIEGTMTRLEGNTPL